MIKKVVCLFAIASLALNLSCKKEETVKTEANKAADGVISPANAAASTTDPVRTPPADGKYPTMEFANKDHDFGEIKEGDKVNYTFDFKNTGTADLLISDAKGSCGCTIPEFTKDPVKPGESGQIKVSFNSAGKHGQQQKSVTLTTNTLDGKEMLHIKASITPKDN